MTWPVATVIEVKQALDVIAAQVCEADHERHLAACEAARCDATGDFTEGSAQWRRADDAELRFQTWREAYEVVAGALQNQRRRRPAPTAAQTSLAA